MMEENKKIIVEEEELKKVKEIASKYEEITIKLGQIQIQEILITQQKEQLLLQNAALKAEYNDTQLKEQELIKQINEKYGQGNLNLDTGEFIVIK